MIRKIVWCYLFVLTLLDVSLNNKLSASAQGKTHGNGVAVHESLIEGISFQEWGGGAGAGDTVGRLAPAGALTLSPASLAFGRAALAAPHTRTVTITNTANETIHLASVAGTTPDFHASFFDSKTLSCGANTSFSVVYLGRRAGWVAAQLYIHTSLGVHAYPVSAHGEPSAWRLHPLVGLKVPLNATLEPLLTLYNPTHTTIQVREVYSSGAWLGLALPDGGGAAPRAQWALPPHTSRPLVRLRIRPLPHHDTTQPLTAYIRIKGNMTGGGLVVGVEASVAPPGEYLSPLQLRLNTRGSRDRPDTVYVSAGSSDGAPARLETGVWGAACSARPPVHAPPPPDAHRDKATQNGVGSVGGVGVHVAALRDTLAAYQEMTRAAKLTLDYGKMWAGYEASMSNGDGAQSNGGAGGGGGVGGGAYCAGWVRVGRAALPYSVRVLPGTLTFNPKELHFVVGATAEGGAARDLEAINEFPEPLHIAHVHFPKEVEDLFHTESLAPLSLAAGARGVACRLRLRSAASASSAAAGGLQAHVTLHTNLTDYSVPLLLYEGSIHVEWQWPNSADGTLRLGTLSTSSTRYVHARLHNAGPASLCLTHLAAELPAPAAASFHLQPEPDQGQGHGQGAPSCVPARGYLSGVLTVVAPLAEGVLTGALHVHTQHARAAHVVQLRVRAGRLTPEHVTLPPAAPYVWSTAALQLENSMSVRVRVLDATPPRALPALSYLPPEEGALALAPGLGVAGRVQYAPEVACSPLCCTGLLVESAEGAAWAARARRSDEETLRLDAALQRARYALYTPHTHNFTLHLHTDEMVQVPVTGSASVRWPRVWSGGAARAGLAAVGVGVGVPLRLRAVNPSERPLLVQPRRAVLPIQLGGEEEGDSACVGCVWSASSFSLGEWRVVRGAAAAWRHNASDAGDAGDSAPYLLLQPRAEVEFTVNFAPAQPTDLAAYLYLRNNLTILERVLVTGRGAHPAFELGGRKPNSSTPIVLEVTECGAAGGGAGVARRTLVLRNTGRVPLRLRDWRVAGVPCAARAFRLEPCTAARLAPGEELQLQLQFGADWTRSRAHAALSVRAGPALARFSLTGLAPARLVAACGPRAARAPFESRLRYLAVCLAVLALVAAAALGAADAERALRRHRTARLHHVPPRAPLDLRALAAPAVPAGPAPCPPAAAAPAPRRRRTPRRRPHPPDPAAERRAFERWRAGVAEPRAHHTEEDSRSEEEGEPVSAAAPSLPSPLLASAPAPPRGDASSSSPDSSPQPRDSYSSMSRRAAAAAADDAAAEEDDEEDEEEREGASSGDESSSPGEEATRAPGTWGRERRRSAEPHANAHVAPAEHAPFRGSRLRRESAEARRAERTRADADNSSNGAAPLARAVPRPHARKERGARRRSERAPSPPPRAPPAPASPVPAPPPVRWGASWSDVVSRSNLPAPNEGGEGGGSAPPLAPIGSDVRRRHGSHSLFYYGGAPAWPPAPPPVPVPVPTPAAPGEAPPPHAPAAAGQYAHAHAGLACPIRWREDEGGYRSLEALWTGGAAAAPAPGASWLWGTGTGAAPKAGAGGGSAAVRPPPGFAVPRPVRPYDPFQSLASIWTPAALDWRLESPAPSPSPAPSATPPLPDGDRD